jgi:hypothetical protein
MRTDNMIGRGNGTARSNRIIDRHLIFDRLSSKKRAQVFSLDFIFATVIFIVILVMAATSWNSLGSKINYVRTMRDMSIVSSSAMSYLVDSEGIPADWNRGSDINLSAIIPGLCSAEPGIIDGSKADKIIEWGNSSYDELKSALGISGPDYEFLLQIGEQFTGRYENSSKDVFGIDRLMAYENGTLVEVKMRIWH